MNRRSFIRLLAALPAALSWRRLWPAAPVAAAALEVAEPVAAALTVSLPAAETFPFLWGLETTSFLLAAPLIDTLVADEIGSLDNYAEN